jgi:hypothetical protein
MVEVKLIRDPESRKPVILAAPKITLFDGTTGIVHMEGAGTLEIEATVEPVKLTAGPHSSAILEPVATLR